MKTTKPDKEHPVTWEDLGVLLALGIVLWLLWLAGAWGYHTIQDGAVGAYRNTETKIPRPTITCSSGLAFYPIGDNTQKAINKWCTDTSFSATTTP